MLLLFNFQWSTRLSPFSRTAYILYHISFRLSRGFSKVFEVFFKKFFEAPLFKRSLCGFGVFFKTAYILYHKPSVLSRGFSKVFWDFSKFFSQPSRSALLPCFLSIKLWRISRKLRCFLLPWYLASIRYAIMFPPPTVHRARFAASQVLPFIGCFYIYCAFLPDSLYIIPQSPPFVKGFFDIFFDLSQHP